MYSLLVLRLVCLVLSQMSHFVFLVLMKQGHVVGNRPSVPSYYQGKLMVNGGNLQIPHEVIGVITIVSLESQRVRR
jgi:hypothetical protein